MEPLLADEKRLFIRGEAGLGKTTLLQWIAVRSARNDFPAKMLKWKGTVPFFVPLRRYANRALPAPESFAEEIGRHIADEMPKGWIHDQLRSGKAIILVDGVDELPENQREEAKTWLSDLVAEFENSRFVVTSRPGATQSEWLSREDFLVLDLESMSMGDIHTFVSRWHDAVRSLCVDNAQRDEINDYEQGLIQVLNAKSHIRKLAGYPLLCALICALYKDRRATLPSNRMELYDVALEMILGRRDAERKLAGLKGLSRTEKTLLLGDLAYWLIRNGQSDIEIERAISRFNSHLERMPQVDADGSMLYQHLLERSGLLREPIAGRVDFIHRSFQEYLAARAAITQEDDIGQLVRNAHLDQWSEVVIMAVGHATSNQRKELISGLLKRADHDPALHDSLALLTLASLETAPELSADLRAEIQRRAKALLPPQTVSAAKSFASAGSFVLNLLATARPRTAQQTVTTIRALAETRLKEALPILAEYRHDTRKSVQDELIRCWSRFDEREYGRSIVRFLQIKAATVELDPEGRSSLLRYYQQATKVLVTMQPGTRFNVSDIPRQVVNLHLESQLYANVDFTGLHTLSELESLTLSGISIIEISFGSFPKLGTLKIERCVLPDVNCLRESSSLRHLDLSNTPIVTYYPLHLLTHLQKLVLYGHFPEQVELARERMPDTEVIGP